MSILVMGLSDVFGNAAYDEELSNLTVQGALDGVIAGTRTIEDGTDIDPNTPPVLNLDGSLPYALRDQYPDFVQEQTDPNIPPVLNLDGSVPYALRDQYPNYVPEPIDTSGPATVELVARHDLPDDINISDVRNLLNAGAIDAPAASREDLVVAQASATAGAPAPEAAVSAPNNEANTTDTPATVLNRHHGAALGNDSIAVRMDNGTHTLLVNAEGQATGYLHYNEETGLVHVRTVDSENPLPQEIENMFTNAESPEVAYAEPAAEEVAVEASDVASDAPAADAPAEEVAVNQTQGFTGPPM